MTVLAGKPRALRITFRLSAEEHTRLRVAAERAGLRVSGYVRFALTRSKPPRAARRIAVEKTLLASILARLGEASEHLRVIASTIARDDRASAALLVERDLSRALTLQGRACRMLMTALGRTAQPQ